VNDKDLRFMLMTVYQFWLARNDARDEELIEEPGCTARRSFFLVEEWVALQAPLAFTLRWSTGFPRSRARLKSMSMALSLRSRILVVAVWSLRSPWWLHRWSMPFFLTGFGS
jgi:hypothetical protein